MKKLIFALSLAVALVVGTVPLAFALVNGGFDSNLNGWTTYGNVSQAVVDGDGAAVLVDTADNGSSIWQGQSIPAANGVFQFDFKVTGLSATPGAVDGFFDALEVTFMFGELSTFPDAGAN